tara:strand:- start:196 stop:672 length:477 start_codon:yes stop_codon:yes gene_type:complete
MSLMNEKDANTKLREAVRDSLNFVKKSVELEKHLLTTVELPEPQKPKGGKGSKTPEKVIAPLQHLTPEECAHLADAFRAFKAFVGTAGFSKRTTAGTITSIQRDLDQMVSDLTGLGDGTLRPLSGAEREAAELAKAEAAEKLAELQAQMAALNASLEL